MKLLKVDALAEAREKLMEHVEECLFETEEIGLRMALSRVLAKPVLSEEAIPPFRRSTVDGYAVRYRDVGGASESIPAFLKVIGEVCLGENTSLSIGPGQCVYVPTGGMLPEGADAMVMVEYCEPFSDREIAVYTSVASGGGVVQIGEDMKEGETVLPAGRRLKPQDIGALAALGKTRVCVYRPWRVTILSTGDELIEPSEEPKPGQIRDINTYGLCAQAEQEGMEITACHIVPDVREELKRRIEEAGKTSDLIVVSGGSSQGKKDMTAEIIDELASEGVFTHGLALKPGKPTILGYDRGSHTLLAGLPGHPAAAMLVFEQVILWFYREKTGQSKRMPVPAKIATNVMGAPGKRTCQLVKIEKTESGEVTAIPIFGKSGMITTLTKADGYLVMEENQEGLKAGETVFVHLWK